MQVINVLQECGTSQTALLSTKGAQRERRMGWLYPWDGVSSMGDWNLQDWKMTNELAGDGICRTWPPTKQRVAYNFGHVCLSICGTITFESLDVESSYLHMRYISPGNIIQIRMCRSAGQGPRRKSRKSLCPQCKALSDHNSGSVKHRALRFACGMNFATTADWMVWPPSLSRDR